MNDCILAIADKAQVTHGSEPHKILDKEFTAFAEYLLNDVINLCNTQVKAFDVAGNEYIVQRYTTREQCVAAIKERFGVKNA